jgi:bifunctional DNA-binding transcriptional regulator/antitoxin component of YhaV-PrlF toxin-antitoxin module
LPQSSYAASVMSRFVAVQGRGTIALPPDVRKRHGLDVPGAQVEVVEREDGVIELHPHVPIPILRLSPNDSEFVARILMEDAEPNAKLRAAARRASKLEGGGSDSRSGTSRRAPRS